MKRSQREDQHRIGELRSAMGGACALFCGLLAVDAAAGMLAGHRALLWAALAGLLYVLVRPPEVEWDGDLLVVRGLLRTQSVRTGLLISVRSRVGMGTRLQLEDLMGGRVRIDPKVLVASPLLWHHVDAGVRRSRAVGYLRNGTRELQSLADHIDGGGAQKVFEASGLLSRLEGVRHAR